MLSDEPNRHDELTSVRAVLLLGIVMGLVMIVYFTTISDRSPIAWDFIAYYQAGEAVLAGEAFVGLEPEFGGGEYVYPPIVVFVFIPYVFLGSWELAFGLHSLVNLLCLSVIGVWCLRELSRLAVSISTVDKTLIMGFVLFSLYPMINLGLGQVDPLVALFLTGVFLFLESHRDNVAGVLLAGAGVIKLFPAVIGIWLLWLRRWQAVAAAVITGLSALILSLVAFGWETNRAFIELIAIDRSRLDAFAEGMSPDFFSVTLIRPIAALIGWAPSWLFLVFSIAIVTPPLWYIYQRTTSRRDRHVAYLATLIAMIIALPSSNLNHLLYLYFPLIVLIYSLDPGVPRRWLLGGMVVMAVPVQPAIIGATLEALLLPEAFVTQVHSAAEILLSFVSVALIATILLLIGCVRYASQEGTRELKITTD